MTETDKAAEQSEAVEVVRKNADAPLTEAEAATFPIDARIFVEVRGKPAVVGRDIRFLVGAAKKAVKFAPCRKVCRGREL